MVTGSWRRYTPQPPSTDEPAPNAKSRAPQGGAELRATCAAAVSADARMAEAYAIEAVCDDFAPRQRAEDRRARTEVAAHGASLAPDNPRVRFIEASVPGEGGSGQTSCATWWPV